MSRLLALQCGTVQMLQVRGDFSMDDIKTALARRESIEVHAYVPELNEVRAFRIYGLAYHRDGYNVEHVIGYIFEGNTVTYVTLHDNPIEADPLNLK